MPGGILFRQGSLSLSRFERSRHKHRKFAHFKTVPKSKNRDMFIRTETASGHAFLKQGIPYDHVGGHVYPIIAGETSLTNTRSATRNVAEASCKQYETICATHNGYLTPPSLS